MNYDNRYRNITIDIEILQFLHYHPLSNRAEIMAGLTRSAQKSPNVWALCAHRTGNECPSLGLSMPNAWSLSAQRLVPESPLTFLTIWVAYILEMPQLLITSIGVV